jgi:hypothetical protein
MWKKLSCSLKEMSTFQLGVNGLVLLPLHWHKLCFTYILVLVTNITLWVPQTNNSLEECANGWFIESECPLPQVYFIDTKFLHSSFQTNVIILRYLSFQFTIWVAEGETETRMLWILILYAVRLPWNSMHITYILRWWMMFNTTAV